MPSIDSFLEPLHQGIWEVVVPRDQITEPLSSEWILSRINVPTPGTIASYRKGQYHLHETHDAWRVHLDRYDPTMHPILHLIDDAPLLLMISETFITLAMHTRRSVIPGIQEELEEQAGKYRIHIILGFLIIIIGLGFILAPSFAFAGITGLLIPSGVFLAGLLSLIQEVTLRRRGERPEPGNSVRGIGIIVIAGILFYIPPLLWGVFILVLLAGWMFASAGMLLWRVFHGRTAVPEGIISRSIIGGISLVLGVLSFIAPEGIFTLFMEILGVLTCTLGAGIAIIGIRLRGIMTEHTPEPEEKKAGML